MPLETTPRAILTTWLLRHTEISVPEIVAIADADVQKIATDAKTGMIEVFGRQLEDHQLLELYLLSRQLQSRIVSTLGDKADTSPAPFAETQTEEPLNLARNQTFETIKNRIEPAGLAMDARSLMNIAPQPPLTDSEKQLCDWVANSAPDILIEFAQNPQRITSRPESLPEPFYGEWDATFDKLELNDGKDFRALFYRVTRIANALNNRILIPHGLILQISADFRTGNVDFFVRGIRAVGRKDELNFPTYFTSNPYGELQEVHNCTCSGSQGCIFIDLDAIQSRVDGSAKLVGTRFTNGSHQNRAHYVELSANGHYLQNLPVAQQRQAVICDVLLEEVRHAEDYQDWNDGAGYERSDDEADEAVVKKALKDDSVLRYLFTSPRTFNAQNIVMEFAGNLSATAKMHEPTIRLAGWPGLLEHAITVAGNERCSLKNLSIRGCSGHSLAIILALDKAKYIFSGSRGLNCDLDAPIDFADLYLTLNQLIALPANRQKDILKTIAARELQKPIE